MTSWLPIVNSPVMDWLFSFRQGLGECDDIPGTSISTCDSPVNTYCIVIDYETGGAGGGSDAVKYCVLKDMNDLVQLDRSHIKPAAAVLAQAFFNYPVSLYAFPDAQERERKIQYFFQFILHYCVKYGEVYATSPRMEGVAAWLSSDKFPVTTGMLLRSVPLSVFLKIGSGGSGKMKTCGEYFDAVHKRLVPYRHWFLQMVGVEPGYQGKGYSSRLIKPVLAKVDNEGLDCFLETQDEQDVRIYEHFGFRIIDESPVHGTGLISRAMLRKPGRK